MSKCGLFRSKVKWGFDMMFLIDHRDDLRVYKLVEIGIGHVGKNSAEKLFLLPNSRQSARQWRAAA